jgi:hypothetical protein
MNQELMHALIRSGDALMLTKAVRRYVSDRRKDDDWSDELEPMAQLAISLAESIDAGNVTGPMARELRATLAELAPLEVHADAFDLLAAEMSAAMGDAED